MAIVTTEKDLAAVRRSGQILADALQATAAAVRPGISTAALNTVADQAIRQAGGTPSFIGYEGYPAALCVSINNEVVHGIPRPDRIIAAGDIVGLDLGVNYDGWFTDHAITVGVGSVTPAATKLMNDTQQSLQIGLQQIKPGNRIGDIGAAIQQFLEARHYGVVRQLTGHGVGRAVHEEPPIPNYGQAGTGPVLTEGMVLAVEPMVTLGGWEVETLPNGWTVVTADGNLAAHFEDTILVTTNGFELLTKPSHGSSRR